MKWSYKKSMNQNWRAIEIATYYLWTWLEKVTRICENVTVFISTNIDYLFDEIYSYFLSKVLFLVRICQKYFCKVSLIEVKLKVSEIHALEKVIYEAMFDTYHLCKCGKRRSKLSWVGYQMIRHSFFSNFQEVSVDLNTRI